MSESGADGVDWRPGASLDALKLRARLNALIRTFFAERDVMEVETPVLSQAGNTDPNIASFSLEFSGRTDGAPRTRWLRTSPEFPLKRLLAAGVGDCYELGRVFRDGEAAPTPSSRCSSSTGPGGTICSSRTRPRPWCTRHWRLLVAEQALNS